MIKKDIFKGSLYGMKLEEVYFRNYLRYCMDHIGYNLCKSDIDLWMRLTK